MSELTQLFYTDSEQETAKIAEVLLKQFHWPSCVYFIGELGAGKTTLIKSIIHAYGYQGSVTSPTYNLIQQYPVKQGVIYHLDLYRLEDPSEVEFLALPDLLGQSSLFLIEWPSKAQGYLMPPDATVKINQQADSQQRIITSTFSL